MQSRILQRLIQQHADAITQLEREIVNAKFIAKACKAAGRIYEAEESYMDIAYYRKQLKKLVDTQHHLKKELSANIREERFGKIYADIIEENV